MISESLRRCWRGVRSLLLMAVCGITLLSCAGVDGGFESGRFRGWYREFPHPDAARIVAEPVHDGRYAARFESGPDDRRITGGLRSEVSELFYKAPFGREMWYRFSTLIPGESPAAAFRCVIAQWHAWPDLVRGEAWRSPVIAIEYRLNRFIIRICYNAERVQQDNTSASNNKTILYRSPEHGARDVWHDFIIRAVFDPAGDGRLSVWIDGDHVVEYSGPLGYNDRAGPWFKMGVYRDWSPSTFVVYHDSYRRGRSYEHIGLARPPAGAEQ